MARPSLRETSFRLVREMPKCIAASGCGIWKTASTVERSIAMGLRPRCGCGTAALPRSACLRRGYRKTQRPSEESCALAPSPAAVRSIRIGMDGSHGAWILAHGCGSGPNRRPSSARMLAEAERCTRDRECGAPVAACVFILAAERSGKILVRVFNCLLRGFL